jgi:hypothetical protein
MSAIRTRFLLRLCTFPCLFVGDTRLSRAAPQTGLTRCRRRSTPSHQARATDAKSARRLNHNCLPLWAWDYVSKELAPFGRRRTGSPRRDDATSSGSPAFSCILSDVRAARQAPSPRVKMILLMQHTSTALGMTTRKQNCASPMRGLHSNLILAIRAWSAGREGYVVPSTSLRLAFSRN